MIIMIVVIIMIIMIVIIIMIIIIMMIMCNRNDININILCVRRGCIIIHCSYKLDVLFSYSR